MVVILQINLVWMWKNLNWNNHWLFFLLNGTFLWMFPTLCLQLNKSTHKIPFTSKDFFNSLSIILIAKCSPTFSLDSNIQCASWTFLLIFIFIGTSWLIHFELYSPLVVLLSSSLVQSRSLLDRWIIAKYYN